MELVYWPGTGGNRGVTIYHFIVKNDGTLISHYGLSRSYSDRLRTRNIIRSVQHREKITLSEEDFLYISGLADEIVSGNSRMGVLANSIAIFIHDGNVYENSTAWSEPLFDLVVILFELTPLLDHGLWSS